MCCRQKGYLDVPLGEENYAWAVEEGQRVEGVRVAKKKDLSPSVVHPARIPLTRERWAQIGITVQFLIVVRTLGEFFPLWHVLGTSFSATVTARILVEL